MHYNSTQIRRTQHGRKCETKAHVIVMESRVSAEHRAAGYLCRTQPLAVYASAPEVSVTRGRRLPSIRSAAVRVAGTRSG